MTLAKTVRDFENDDMLGLAVFKERIQERDRVMSETQNRLLKIAKKYTGRLRSPSGVSSRISELLTFDKSNIVLTGRGKSDTHIWSEDRQLGGGTILGASSVASARSIKTFGGAGHYKVKSKKSGSRVIAFRQNRSYDSFGFKLEYPYKKVLRLSIFYYSTHRSLRNRRYSVGLVNQSAPGWSGTRKQGEKGRVYLPYIVNNTWKRHPKSIIRGVTDSERGNPKSRRQRIRMRRQAVDKNGNPRFDKKNRPVYESYELDHAIKTASSFPRVNLGYINKIVREFNHWASTNKSLSTRFWIIEAAPNKDYKG